MAVDDDTSGVPLAPIADRDDADLHVVHGSEVRSARLPHVRMRSSPIVLAPERAARGSVAPPLSCISGELELPAPRPRRAATEPAKVIVALARRRTSVSG